MRYLFCLPFALVLIACSGNKNKNKQNSPSEDQKRQYFIDSFSQAYGFGYYETDSARSFSTFFKKNYPNIKAVNSHDAFPYALEEEYIDTNNIEADKVWFRVIVTKPFQPPYALKIEHRYGRTYVTAKITNGDGGYYTGTLAATLTMFQSDSMNNVMSNTLETMKFWELPRHSRDTSTYLHPELWVMEGINKGKYHYVVRVLPDMIKDKIFFDLMKLVQSIKATLRLKEMLVALGGEEAKIQ